MARGWESKDVESQMEDAREARRNGTPQPNPEELQRVRELEGFQLQRSRILADLQTAANPKYREILQRSLVFLDEKIAGLEKAPLP
jgi:hypothetical protein